MEQQMQLTPLSAVPATFGAHDRIVMLRHEVAELDLHEANRRAKKEMLVEEFRSVLEEGIASAPALFVPMVKGKAQTLSSLIEEALEYDDLKPRAVQLLIDAALGMPVQQAAANLLKAVGAQVAESECGL
jgi:hypothetical protein